MLAHLEQCHPGHALSWLQQHRVALEKITDCPLTTTGVAAAALIDLGFTPAQGEMLCLLLRLPGAAVHALEQEKYGWRNFPFFRDGVELIDDPGPRTPASAHVLGTTVE